MYTVDGLSPDGTGWELLLPGTGFRGVAGRHSGALELPGADGSIPSMNESFMPGILPLRYRIMTSDHGSFMTLLERFNGVFGQRRKLLTVTHEYSFGISRINYAKVDEMIVPEVFSPDVSWYVVNLKFPNPFWRGATLLTSGTPSLTSTYANHTLENFHSTAPINDSLIRVKGAFSTALVGCPVTGDEILINTPLLAGEYAVIDTANWTARKVATDTWTGGTDITAQVHSNKGRGPMLSFEPDQVSSAWRYRVRARATNPTSSPAVEVRARLSYH